MSVRHIIFRKIGENRSKKSHNYDFLEQKNLFDVFYTRHIGRKRHFQACTRGFSTHKTGSFSSKKKRYFGDELCSLVLIDGIRILKRSKKVMNHTQTSID